MAAQHGGLTGGQAPKLGRESGGRGHHGAGDTGHARPHYPGAVSLLLVLCGAHGVALHCET